MPRQLLKCAGKMLYVLIAVVLVAQFVVPLRWAFVPLLVAACHFGNVEILPELTPCRIVILAGLARAVLGGKLRWSPRVAGDRLVLGFVLVAVLSSFAPRLDVPSPLKQALGLIINVVGCYAYGRAFLFGVGAARALAVALACVLLPLGAMMVVEKGIDRNPYYALGARSTSVAKRNGVARARGPFAHPILGGTVGAASMPLMLALYRRRRLLAIAGASACGLIVVTSASSGPLAALFSGAGGVALWLVRGKMKWVRLGCISALVIGHMVSNRGIWYIISYIDLVGGSTGYHRARLIDAAIKDFGGWWLKGTDYTRNWMASGVSWSQRHTDITNYYLHLGVIGGVGLTAVLVLLMWMSCRRVGAVLEAEGLDSTAASEGETTGFEWWCMGACVFAHAVSCISVSYFDQMFVLLYLPIAALFGVGSPGFWNQEEDAYAQDVAIMNDGPEPSIGTT